MIASHNLNVYTALNLLKRGEISAVELTTSVLERIQDIDGRVQAYLKVTPEAALAQAATADARRAAGDDAALLGIPLAIKDNLSTLGVETTCGSKILRGYVPPFDATVVAKLKAAGCVLLGKTNLDAFAMGSSTENSDFFATHNPWDLDRVPGGSSGGSAAAVAAGEALAALGSDTGGSVRQPAAHCGIVGVRPTYGRCSRYGLVAFASSLDQVGPLTRNVKDSALLLQVIAGHDVHDSTSQDLAVDAYSDNLETDISGLRIGVAAEYFNAAVQPDVANAVYQALEVFKTLGAEIVEISLPHTEDALAVYYLIAPAEASANLARFDGVRYGARVTGSTPAEMYTQTRSQGFGPEVKRRIMLGTYALNAGYYDDYYLKAQKVRTLIKNDFDRAFEAVDLIAGPTSPVTAFRLGERVTTPLQMYSADVFTLAQALAGLPALSQPCGFDQAGLPIGLQLSAPAWQETRLLQAAHAYEQATAWHTSEAPLKQSTITAATNQNTNPQSGRRNQ